MIYFRLFGYYMCTAAKHQERMEVFEMRNVGIPKAARRSPFAVPVAESDGVGLNGNRLAKEDHGSGNLLKIGPAGGFHDSCDLRETLDRCLIVSGPRHRRCICTNHGAPLVKHRSCLPEPCPSSPGGGTGKDATNIPPQIRYRAGMRSGSPLPSTNGTALSMQCISRGACATSLP